MEAALKQAVNGVKHSGYCYPQVPTHSKDHTKQTFSETSCSQTVSEGQSLKRDVLNVRFLHFVDATITHNSRR